MDITLEPRATLKRQRAVIQDVLRVEIEDTAIERARTQLTVYDDLTIIIVGCGLFLDINDRAPPTAPRICL